MQCHDFYIILYIIIENIKKKHNIKDVDLMNYSNTVLLKLHKLYAYKVDIDIIIKCHTLVYELNKYQISKS